MAEYVNPELQNGDLFVVLRGPACVLGYDNSWSSQVWRAVSVEGLAVVGEAMYARSWPTVGERTMFRLNTIQVQVVTADYLQALSTGK